MNEEEGEGGREGWSKGGREGGREGERELLGQRAERMREKREMQRQRGWPKLNFMRREGERE